MPSIRPSMAPDIRHRAAIARARDAERQLAASANRLSRALDEWKFSADQPRVPAGVREGGRWTDGAGGTDGATRLDVLFRKPGQSLRRAFGLARLAGLSLYNLLTTQGSADKRAVAGFVSREYTVYDWQQAPDLAFVTTLSRDEVEDACPRLGQVQAMTDAAAAKVVLSGQFMSATQFGTAVHQDLKEQVTALEDQDLVTEKSFSKTFAETRYGEKGSIRIDVLERTSTSIACVYDIKTGVSGLSAARSIEIAAAVQKHFGGTTRIIVTEVRPGRG